MLLQRTGERGMLYSVPLEVIIKLYADAYTYI